jgi:protein-S-isoprenylcysteine O-methyltransferase Ste14
MALQDELREQGNWLFRWRSYLPLLFVALLATTMSHPQFPWGSFALHEAWENICLGISFAGLVVRALVVGYAPAATSGRNTRSQVANSLNTTGMYSIVRHPLYIGNFLIGFGITLVCWVWWLPAIYALLFLAYYERIMLAEEAFLHRRFGEEFERWAAKTPAFWPRFSQWRRPALSFSFRNVLRREYTGLIVVILGHTSEEFFEHLASDHRVVWERFWTVLLFGGVFTYFVLRALKRRTTLLDVQGR